MAAAGRPLWMPAFNYRFLRSGTFDVAADPSEVGPLTEHYRTQAAGWRTPVPVFSIAGSGPPPRTAVAVEIDPFGADSDFAVLERAGGVLLFYGAPFSTTTILHHAERSPSGPAYRYDKRFPGTVVLPDGTARVTVLLYHVRPAERHLDYDWDRLLADAVAAGICRVWEADLTRLVAASVRGLVGFWRERLATDRLYPLDARSREWVEPLLERLGRRFELADFEPSAA